MTAFKDALRSFLRVWLVGTLMLFLPGLFGWINDVTSWARDNGTTPFPDARGLGFIFVAAITSAFVAAGAAILRYAENLSGHSLIPRPAGAVIPTGPSRNRPRNDAGAAVVTWGGLAAVLLVVVLLVILF